MQILTSLQWLGPARVMVSFQLEPGERGSPATEWEPEDPGEDAYVIVLSASINGEEVDSQLFDNDVVTTWQDAILVELREEAENAYIEAALS